MDQLFEASDDDESGRYASDASVCEAMNRAQWYVCLANWYGESILPVIALRKWTESYFRDAPVAVKRSEPRSRLRWRNSE